MLNTVRAIVQEGKIELLESVYIPNGTELPVTILPGDEQSFWLPCILHAASNETSLNRWNVSVMRLSMSAA